MSIDERAAANAGRFDSDLGIQHHFPAREGARGYAKQMLIRRGFEALSHSHPTDHVSCLASGRVLVATDREPAFEVVGPGIVFIEAGLAHSIQALEDSVWFCIHDIVVIDLATVDDVILGRI